MLTRQHIEARLVQAERRARLVRLITASAYLAACIAGAVLLVGVFAVMGLITVQWIAALAFGTIALLSIAAWLVLLLVTVLAPVARPRAASAVEREQPALLDRLNTLVYLESRGESRSPLATTIAQQATQVLAQHPARAKRRSFPRLKPLAVLAASLLLAVLFYRHYQPIERIREAEAAAAAQAAKSAQSQLLIPPDAQAAPEDPRDLPWAEIRIRAPGRDLRTSRWDLIPVEIEVASNEPLAPTRWTLERLGVAEKSEAEFEPSDPHYALHEQEIDLAALAAEDWDVFAYYAESATHSGRALRSDVYFVEAVPLQDALEQLPGGDEGLAFEWLDELSALVARQENAVRQQRRMAMLADPDEGKHARRLLARELAAQAVEHERLKSKMAGQLEPGAAADELREELQHATEALKAASEAIADDARPVQGGESTQALAALVAARKAVQRTASEHPELFRGAVTEQFAEQLTPDNWQQWLRAAETLPQLAERQQLLAEQLGSEPPPATNELESLAEEQQRLLDELAELQTASAPLDKSNPADWQAAREQLAAAAEALRKGEPQAGEHAARGAERLAELAQPLEEARDNLADRAVDPLASALEEQIEKLAAVAQEPETAEQAERQAISKETQEIADQLSRVADRSPAERPELSRQFDLAARERVNKACEQLANTPSADDARSAANAAREPLENAAKALAADQSKQLASDVARQSQSLRQQRSTLDEARDWVKNALRQQRSLQREATPSQTQQFPQLAQRQEQLRSDLKQFMQQFANELTPAQGVCEQASERMSRSASALQSSQPAAQQAVAEAADALQQLDDQLQQRQQAQHSAESQQLSELGDRTSRALGAAAERPHRYGPQQREQIGTATKMLMDHLREFTARADVQQQLAKQGAAGPTDQQQKQVADDAERLASGNNEQQRQAAAERMKQMLQQTKTQLRSGQNSDPRGRSSALRAEGQPAIERGLRQLRSLARRQQQQQGRERAGNVLSPETTEQLRGDAARQLVEGLASEYGHNESAAPLLQRLQRDLNEPRQPADLQLVERLVQEIQQQRVESAPQPRPDQPDAEITNIDSARLPPEYRQAIEQYFEKLSAEP